MKAPASFSPIEPLEARIAPATLDVSAAGVLTYTAGAGIGNSLTITISGANYVFGDTGAGETITVTGAGAVGFTGSGTTSVSGPNTSVSSITVDLGNQSDQFALLALTDPLELIDGVGTDSVFVTGTLNVGGALQLEAEAITVNVAIGGATSVEFTADTMAINAAVGASGRVTLAPLTAARPISLGTETAGNLSFTDLELDRFTAPVLEIGSSTAGGFTLTAALTVTNAAVLSLKTNSSIDTSGGTLAVASLAIEANGISARFSGANDFQTVAASLTDPNAVLVLTDATGFAIGSVDGITGLTAGSSSSSLSEIFLNAGAVTQAAGAAITTPQLHLFGAGPFTLTDATNDTDEFAADITGSLSYTDATGFVVATITGTNGITTANGNVTLTALGGDLNILNADGTSSPDIDAGAGRVTLTAGAAGSDFAIVLDANAGITGTVAGGSAAVTLVADHMTIGAAINAGTNFARLRPFETATTIALGGTDGGARLGLTDAELDFISAASLQVGQQTASPLAITAAIAPANVDTLDLTGANVSGAGSITVETLSITTQTPITLNGANDVDFVTFNFEPGPAISFADADGFTLGLPGAGTTLSPKNSGVATFNAGAAGVIFEQGLSVQLSFAGTAPGTQRDQIVVIGTVTLDGPSLTPFGSGALPQGTEFVILDNDGTADPVTGTFKEFSGAPLPEGAMLAGFSPSAFITYTGGDGNDVAIVTLPPLAVQVAPGGKSATYRDVDGDVVTVKTTKGAFDGSEFRGIETGANGAGQLQELKLDADFTGTNLTITAKPGADGGNGFVNVGFLNAAGVDLGAVSIAGDLSATDAGTTGGDAKVPAIKSLTVQSLGLLGASTQPPGANKDTVLDGALPKLVVKGDLRRSLQLFDADGRIGSATIGGSIAPFVVGGSIIFDANAGIGSLKVGGDIRGDVRIETDEGAIGTITVGGSIIGEDASDPVEINVFGQSTAPTKGSDLALKTLKVGGSVEFLRIQAGSDFTTDANADASIGTITVGGDWLASSVTAGTEAGADGEIGTADDVKSAGGPPRDNPALFSTIGSFTVKGQALGTATPATDMFGIVAERIGKAKVGGRTFAFKTGTNEAFFAAPTFDGDGAENPAFDFTIRELGSATPTPDFGAIALTITGDGKTASYTDVDGDKVTIKRSAGAFVVGDFIFADNALGGRQLRALTVTAAPDNALVNLSITAVPGPDGGNGFVNVGVISAAGVAFGSVSIAGDLGQFTGALGVGGKPGVASLTAHSLGTLGTSTGAGAGAISGFTGGLGKLTVGADVRGANLSTSKIGSIVIGGAFVADAMGNGTLRGTDSIGSVKIGGSVRGGAIISNGPLGAISIGGDFIGQSGNPVLTAFGQLTAPAKGLDLAIKSLTVKGSVEKVRIEVGRGSDANADASIGAISVGRAWLASSVLIGADDGADNFTGTADDTKTLGATTTRDVATRFSTIASITIKGQALGSTASGDSFGIVAETIGKAKIGARTFAFAAATKEAFAAAPTGPGATGLASDFFVREIV